MDINLAKLLFFSNQFKILEIRKCYSMAIIFTFDIAKIICPDTLTDSRILSLLKLKNAIFHHYKSF